jgi:hypothetical protein
MTANVCIVVYTKVPVFLGKNIILDNHIGMLVLQDFIQ